MVNTMGKGKMLEEIERGKLMEVKLAEMRLKELELRIRLEELRTANRSAGYHKGMSLKEDEIQFGTAVPPMPSRGDYIPNWFANLENLWEVYGIEEKHRGKLTLLLVNEKARRVVSRLSVPELKDYVRLKEAIFQEYLLDPSEHLKKFYALEKEERNFCPKRETKRDQTENEEENIQNSEANDHSIGGADESDHERINESEREQVGNAVEEENNYADGDRRSGEDEDEAEVASVQSEGVDMGTRELPSDCTLYNHESEKGHSERNLEIPELVELPSLTAFEHGVSSGPVTILDAETFLATNSKYDGEGPAAYWWVSRGFHQSPSGARLKDENGSSATLKRSTGRAFVISLPERDTSYDYDWLGVWSEEFNADFGHLRSHQNAKGPPSPRMLGVTVENKLNYEALHNQQGYEIRWMMDADDVHMQTVAKLDPGDYMSFGLSEDNSKSLMVLAEAIVAWNEEKGKGVDEYNDEMDEVGFEESLNARKAN